MITGAGADEIFNNHIQGSSDRESGNAVQNSIPFLINIFHVECFFLAQAPFLEPASFYEYSQKEITGGIQLWEVLQTNGKEQGESIFREI